MEFIHTQRSLQRQRDRAGASIECKHQKTWRTARKPHPPLPPSCELQTPGQETRPTGGSPVKRCLAGKARSRGASPGNAAQTFIDHKMARTGA